jgi:hypothetical protein
MFALVASGSIFTFFASFLTFHPKSLFTIVSIFSHPISKVFFGIPTYLPHFVIVTCKWLMLLLVLYRLFVFIKNQDFVIPSNYKGIWVVITAAGIVAFALGEASILLYSGPYSLPDRIWSLLYHYAFPVAADTLPLVFTVTELVAIKNLTHHSSGTPNGAP